MQAKTELQYKPNTIGRGPDQSQLQSCLNSITNFSLIGYVCNYQIDILDSIEKVVAGSFLTGLKVDQLSLTFVHVRSETRLI
jgi:hypothetical protein